MVKAGNLSPAHDSRIVRYDGIGIRLYRLGDVIGDPSV